MKTIDSYDTLLQYLLKLGFQGNPEASIQHRQDLLCCAADAIEGRAAVGKIGLYSFSIRCRLYTSAEGFRFPWVSTFLIRRMDGSSASLNMLSVKPEDWMRKQGRM